MKDLKLLKSEDGEIFVFRNKRPRFIAKIETFSPFHMTYEIWEAIDFYKDFQYRKEHEEIVKDFILEKIKFGEL